MDKTEAESTGHIVLGIVFVVFGVGIDSDQVVGIGLGGTGCTGLVLHTVTGLDFGQESDRNTELLELGRNLLDLDLDLDLELEVDCTGGIEVGKGIGVVGCTEVGKEAERGWRGKDTEAETGTETLTDSGRGEEPVLRKQVRWSTVHTVLMLMLKKEEQKNLRKD